MFSGVLIATIEVAGGGTVEIYGQDTANGVELTVKLSDDWNSDYNMDLNGLFLDFADGGSSKLTVFGEKANNLNGVTDDEGHTIGWDLAVSLGSTVGGSDGETSLTMSTIVVSDMSLADLDGANIGIRASSTGLDSEGSLKLVGEIEIPEPIQDDLVQDDFPAWAQDISHIVLYFDQDEGDIKPSGGDGFYTVKIDDWQDQTAIGGDDLDNSIGTIVNWLVEHDPNVDADSDLTGVMIKGGIQTTEYFAFGTHNTNGTDADPIPADAPQIDYPPAVGDVNGPEIDVTYDYDQVFF